MGREIILIAGGDLRMLYAAQRLRKKYDVRFAGFRKEKLPPDVKDIVETSGETADSCGNAVESADILLLPPVTADAQGKIPAPYGAVPIEPEAALSQLRSGGLVLIGNDKGIVRKLCAERDCGCKGYINSSILAQANAVPTAEGALKVALEETGRTIWGSRVLVTGCGRIGTLLADRLRGMGAHVTAAARKECDRVRMETMGIRSTALPLEKEDLSGYDLIFNTVPAEIFSEKHLRSLRNDCPLIELASVPGGAEENAVKRSGCRYIWASGLPLEDIG